MGSIELMKKALKELPLNSDDKEKIIELSLLRVLMYEEITRITVKLMGERAWSYLSDFSVEEHLKEADIEASLGVIVKMDKALDHCETCGTTEFLCGHNKRG